MIGVYELLYIYKSEDVQPKTNGNIPMGTAIYSNIQFGIRNS